MTKTEIKRLKKWLAPLNQNELKRNIEVCKQYFIKGNMRKQEEAIIYKDTFSMILYHAKLRTSDPLEVIKRIETAFNN